MRTRRLIQNWGCLVLLLVLTFAAGSLRAADTTWQCDPAVLGEFADGANWTNGVPGGTDNAYVDNGGTVLLASSESANNLYVGCTGSASFLQVYGTTTIAHALVLGQSPGAQGTYELRRGVLQYSDYYMGPTFGDGGTGTFVQTGGTHKLNALSLGDRAGSHGTYELSGGDLIGSLSGTYMMVGYCGTGSFRQSAGRNLISTGTGSGYGLWVGAYPGSVGTYEMSGGQLILSGSDAEIRVGLNGDGRFFHAGGYVSTRALLISAPRGGPVGSGLYELSGTGQLSVFTCEIYDNGVFRQSGGTSKFDDGVWLGGQNGGEGRFEMSGGTLTATILGVGLYTGPHGLFRQSGGDCTMGRIWLGSPVAGATAAYELLAGTLKADELHIWDSGAGLHAYSTFLQTGGSCSAGFVELYPTCRYVSTGGSLSVSAGLAMAGQMDFNGQAGSLNIVDGLADFSQGTIVNAQNAQFACGPNSILVVPQGWDAGAIFGSTDIKGIVHTAGTPLVLPPGRGLSACGVVNDWLHNNGGTIAANGAIGLTLLGGLRSDGGSVQLGTGTLEISRSDCGITDTILSAREEYIGRKGVGRFSQNGGSNTTSSMSIGKDYGHGTYEMIDGTLSTGYLAVADAYETEGKIIQSGGQISVSGQIWMGSYGDCHGSYEMSGGGLSCLRLSIGHQGNATGIFVQSGGAVNVGSDLVLGNSHRDTYGRYELNGGSVAALKESIGWSGQGEFVQTGGTNNVSQDMYVGEIDFGLYGAARGTYELTGGSNQIGRTLYMSYDDLCQSTYTVGGGMLTAGSVYVGYAGTANFIVNSPAAQVAVSNLYIGNPNGAGKGTFQISDPAASIAVRALLHLGAGSTLACVPGSTIHMTGASFKNQNIDPAALAGLANLELIFEGGPAAVDTLEAAGRDFGAVPDGFTGNFKLHCLRLGGDDLGQVKLVDASDNQPSWTGREALYVDSLILGPASRLYLNGLNLYYVSGSIDPSAVVNLSGGHLTQVPEPAALSLLLVGGLALVRPRRA